MLGIKHSKHFRTIQTQSVDGGVSLKNYIIKRISLSVLVLLGVISITFFLTRVIPSDPAAQWAGPRSTQEQIEKARLELGLDKPLYAQFEKYLSDLVHGDLGYSLRTKRPILKELATYIPSTVELVALSTVLAVIIGIPLGLGAAKSKGKMLDHFSRYLSVGAVSLPTFWVALFLQLIFF